jgi:multicomponent Na+:H+ antiporter subunit G
VTLIQDIIAIFLIICGTFFMLVGSIGINRLPDFYTRIHASGKVDIVGILTFLSGLAVFEGFTLNSAKILLIIVFVLITSPAASHQLARRAFYYGLKPMLRNSGNSDKKGKKE